MGGLQDVPDYGGGIHTAADHGDEIGQENHPHPAVLPHLSHTAPTVNQLRAGGLAESYYLPPTQGIRSGNNNEAIMSLAVCYCEHRVQCLPAAWAALHSHPLERVFPGDR